MMLSIFTVSPMLPMKPITQPVPACTSGIILILHLLKTSIDISAVWRTMTKLKNKKEYKVALDRIEELLPLVDDDTPHDNKYLVELDLRSDLVSEYEEEYYPVKQPSLVDMLKLRMYELELTQNKLSELLGVCPSRISDYLSGRAEPTLKVARKMSKKLNIDASIVQGV